MTLCKLKIEKISAHFFLDYLLVEVQGNNENMMNIDGDFDIVHATLICYMYVNRTWSKEIMTDRAIAAAR